MVVATSISSIGRAVLGTAIQAEPAPLEIKIILPNPGIALRCGPPRAFFRVTITVLFDVFAYALQHHCIPMPSTYSGISLGTLLMPVNFEILDGTREPCDRPTPVPLG